MNSPVSRRELLIASTALASGSLLKGTATMAHAQPDTAPPKPADLAPVKKIKGSLTGKDVFLREVDRPPMPEIAPPGIVHNGKAIRKITIDSKAGLPDVRSFKRKFALLLPATNTSMEHELWSLIVKNEALTGVGVHTTNIQTPKPQLKTKQDLENYRQQIIGGLHEAVKEALLAEPQYFILGMSMEHVIFGLNEIEASMNPISQLTKASWALWHEAAPTALKKLNAKRIGLITPFDTEGNKNASKMFSDLGFEVVSTIGFACANALHIAHVPDSAKEQAITEYLATKGNRLDAVVQCGTNMSMLGVIETLEPKVGIPILGINPTLLWFALRETGITSPIVGAGRLLREA